MLKRKVSEFLSSKKKKERKISKSTIVFKIQTEKEEKGV